MDVVFVTSLGGYELARQPRPPRRDQKPTAASPMSRQVCSQTWFDPILRRFAESFPAVSLRYRCKLESFESTGDGVMAVLRDMDSGAKETVIADYVAACDGATSRIRRSLDIGLTGPGVLGHPVHVFFRYPDLLERCGCRTGTFFLAIDQKGLWANIRVIDPREGLWRLMVLDTDGTLTPETVDREAYLRRVLGFPLEVEWVGTSIWTRRGVVAERYREGRIFLVGDSAHQLSPTGALGMNTGISDAVDLGWKLAATFDGWGGGSLLDSYDGERRPAGVRNVTISTDFHMEHASYDDDFDVIADDSAEGAALRERLAESLVRDVAPMLVSAGLQLGYRYDPSPICIPDGSPAPPDDPREYVPVARPGSRAPHAWIEDGRSTLDLFGRGFVLLRLGDDAPKVPEIGAAAAARNVPFETVSLASSEIEDLYQGRLVLVRPDGHVAWRSNDAPEDAKALIDRVRGAL